MKTKKKVLNTYACIGGNRQLWEDVEVTSIEIDPKIAAVYKKLYPKDRVIITDAHQYLQEHYHEYDFIWSSPPCQKNSKMAKANCRTKKVYPDLRLYEEVILLQHHFKGKWVVENVVPYYEPLIKAQRVGRHLFWSNFTITPFDIEQPKGFINMGNLEARKQLMDWLGIHFEEKLYYENNHCPVQVLRNAVHPKIGEHIFNCAFGEQATRTIEQKNLFSAVA